MMGAFFPSFQSSSMPKRLLRYALSRLELLDSDALDLENLDLALGRNTVFEFRDVGIRLKKLEELLKLPKTFSLQKAKVLLLRVTIPMDFYTSPITISIDGVDVKLKVLSDEKLKTDDKTSTTTASADSSVVPNTVDLAQSFLETQPSSERKKLEEALAADTQDLVASVAMTDDSSEEEAALGTGQPLSLPTFLANFLQGIIDRMQIKITGVTFQLDMEVPVDMSSPNIEPVSFQIALQDIEIEGVTTQQANNLATSPTIVPKEGKRQISLANIRASLISEADIFPTLTRSPSMTSPSVASSPPLTRNPPSRQTTTLLQESFHENDLAASRIFLRNDSRNSPPMMPQADLRDQLLEASREDKPDQSFASPGQGLGEHLVDFVEPREARYSLGDSEEALGIPYDLSQHVGEEDNEGPATPRAFAFQHFDDSGHGEQLYSHQGRDSPSASVHQLAPRQPDLSGSDHEAMHDSTILYPPSRLAGHSADDLTQSQIYTHEEAESMYMSAFSNSEIPPISDTPQMAQIPHEEEQGATGMAVDHQEVQEHLEPFLQLPHQSSSASPPRQTTQSSEGTPVQSPRSSPRQSTGDLIGLESKQAPHQSPRQSSPRPTQHSPHEPLILPRGKPSGRRSAKSARFRRGMPGGWSDNEDDDYSGESDEEDDSPLSSPAFSRASLAELSIQPNQLGDDYHQEDATTPRGATKVVKEILHLQNISIYIPSQHKQVNMEDSVAGLSPYMETSVYPTAPGAFSTHQLAVKSGQVESEKTTSEVQVGDHAIEIDLSPVSIRFDASLALILAMIVGKLLKAVEQDSPIAPPKTIGKEEKTKAQEIQLTVQEISIDFLNLLGGSADAQKGHLHPAASLFEPEVLLNATLGSLAVSVSPTEVTTQATGRSDSVKQSATLTKIELQRFRFGYANGDILSFDHTKPMSMSVRDAFLSDGHDIGIKITQSKDSTRTQIETLPLVLQINLQRLDETFGWFGGLSGFLNMSTSMTSSPGAGVGAGTTPTPAPAPLPPPKTKGVRFDTPINPEDKSAMSENKVNLRIGGAFIELLGKECSVVAESHAIKLVSRDEGIGIACSMMRLSGPLLAGSSADPAINTEIGGVRLDFLTTPKDSDLEKLLELITPSKAKFDRGSDEIMVDTLLRQRRKGSVLRANVETIQVRVKNMAQLAALPGLAEEMAKLATVAKYLPEDDRPGLLTLAKVQKFGTNVSIGGTFGDLSGELSEFEIGHISVPSLVAIAISGVSLRRNKTEELISSSVLYSSSEIASRGPVIMARMIGDEIEPVIKLRFQDISVEYRVPTIMDILGLESDATPQDFEESLAASVANLGDQAHTALARQSSSPTEETKNSKPMTLDVAFRDCLIGLNPLKLKSKMILALTDASVAVVLPKDEETRATLIVNKASVLLTDDASQGPSQTSPMSTRRRSSSAVSPQVVELSTRGFVDICYISAAMVAVSIAPGPDGEKQVEVEARDDLLVLETCADSTQTLIALANALSPPTPPSKENKYRTNVVPVQDLLASISAEAFGRPEGEYDFDQDFAGAQELAGSGSNIELAREDSLRIESQYYGEHDEGEEIFDATRLSSSSVRDAKDGVVITNPSASASNISDGDDLVIHDNFYGEAEAEKFTAKIWNPEKNTHDKAPTQLVKRSPLRVSVRDVHLIWNLFDGYDWANTREVINKAVQNVEAKAFERQARLGGGQAYEEEFEDEEAIGDFLFNSIYIGIPANRDPQDLSRAINEGLQDNATETESNAPTTVTTTTNRTMRRTSYPKSRRLRLQRSKHHKITFELHGVNIDLVAYSADAEITQSSIDVKVKNLDIFDHVPTSTWKKFATYDQDHGEREMGKSMVHLELLNVRPLPELGASEIVLRATVLPLRLHVDQDALDFITRFFEFKDESIPVHSSPSDVPFLQRAEVNDISVKLDFKPKRVDYAGLRSGHTTEFMNFITLEESRMVLRHVIIYGVSGFERLGRTVQDIWTPDVRNNQLPGVIAGLAPVRSLVNIGSGFKDLVEIPLKEYKKDGRVIRSISKGAAAFARTTGTELVKFGAKLAVGTQYALQGAEEMLAEQPTREALWEDEDMEPEERKQISLYADHPTGVIQGIRGGYRSLARDVNLARDAIIAVPGEVMESSSPAGAAKAVLRRAPTIIFRPAVGVSKAIGQTLMGATNSLDRHNQRRIDEKYKKH